MHDIGIVGIPLGWRNNQQARPSSRATSDARSVLSGATDAPKLSIFSLISLPMWLISVIAQ